jgi:hypothetical protein
MTKQTTYKPYTINELVMSIYEDNLSHFDDRDTGDDCDCNIHNTLRVIFQYWD